MVMQVIQVVGDVGLGKHSCLLQVTVGHVASWIVSGHDALLDVFWEGHVPQHWVLAAGKEDTAHSSSSGIHGSNDTGVVEHNLGKMCWLICYAVCQHLKVCEVVTQVMCDLYPMLV